MKFFGGSKTNKDEIQWIDIGTLIFGSSDIVEEMSKRGQEILKQKGLRGSLAAVLPEGFPGYFGHSYTDMQAVVLKNLELIEISDSARRDFNRGNAFFLFGKMPPESELAVPLKKLAGLRVVGLVTYR